MWFRALEEMGTAILGLSCFSKKRIIHKQRITINKVHNKRSWLFNFSVSAPKDMRWDFHVSLIHLLLKLFGFYH